MLAFVTCRDRFACTVLLVGQLQALGAEVVLVDNDSTYLPLLAWYQTCGLPVERLGRNLGPRAAWDAGLVPQNEFWCLTDCDLDLAGVPSDLFGVLLDGLARHSDVAKVGVGLRLDDLPDTSLGRSVRAHEAQFWQVRRDERYYEAFVDTTLAVYRPGEGFPVYGPALRAVPPYCARHTTWYLDPTDLPEDERWYLDRLASEFSCWGPRLFQGGVM